MIFKCIVLYLISFHLTDAIQFQRLNGTATQRGSFSDWKKNKIHGANLALDGNTDQRWDGGSCGHTEGGHHSSWWHLDLGQKAKINRVDLYYRNERPDRMNGFKLFISDTFDDRFPRRGNLLYNDEFDDKIPNTYLSITLDTHLPRYETGRHIVFYNERSYNYKESAYVELCEVEVYGCYENQYGKQCEHTCLENCDACDLFDGYCSACKYQYFGYDCNQRCYCGNHYHCDKITGCPPQYGCATGYRGKFCNEEILCVASSTIANGFAIPRGGNFFPGEQVTYKCSNGYRLNRSSPRKCELSGTWNFQEPVCQDIDECAVQKGGCQSICNNTPGSFRCDCYPGYNLLSDRKSCQDIDECAVQKGGCQSICNNTPGSFRCDCYPGYNLLSDRKSCQDIDECAVQKGGCQSICNNTPGSFRCDCYPEYNLLSDRKSCQDIDECAVQKGGCQSICNNTPGSFRCDCYPGYNLLSDRKSCQDIDECAVQKGGCQSICNNTPGSFRCDCYPGYNLLSDRKSCQDIDECAVQKGGCQSICNNTPGSFRCDCYPGYNLLSDRKSCQDIDECAVQKGGCQSICNNTPGSFRCDCYPGYNLLSDRKSCQDIDECAVQKGGCQSICNNTPGSFRCDCYPGYNLLSDRKSCQDIDECAVQKGGCQSICNNTPGSFRCDCYPGYNLLSDRKSCQDIDECAVQKGGCQSICNNTPGSFRCDCYPGYNLLSDRKSCQDIDECAVQKGGCQSICNNTPGSFRCDCYPGYNLLSDRKSCQDIDECAVQKGGCQSICNNTPGSFRCDCYPGYNLLSDRKSCQDIDECAVQKGGCQSICNNTPGSFRCDCYPGYNLLSDRKSCQDIDECAVQKGGCQSICNNTPGSFRCDCYPGYNLLSDRKSCQDIDECAVQKGGCQSICNNTPGSFRCDCYPGYNLLSDRKSCQDIDECAVQKGGCQSICNNTPGSFRCDCYPGYNLLSDRKSCQEIPCEEPESVEFANKTVHGRKLEVGSAVEYSCQFGYKHTSGNLTRTCQIGPRLDGAKPTCTVILCKAESTTIDHGSVDLPDGHTEIIPNLNVTYSCNEGYQLHGSSVRTCKLGGTWSDVIPSCRACPHPKFGDGCTQSCHCQENKPCNHVTGFCKSCAPGWNGTACDKGCKSPYFGIGCQQKCNCFNGTKCEPIDGICEVKGCDLGWTGLSCSLAVAAEHSSSSDVIVIACVLLVCLIVVVLPVIVFLYKRRHSSQPKTSLLSSQGTSNENNQRVEYAVVNKTAKRQHRGDGGIEFQLNDGANNVGTVGNGFNIYENKGADNIYSNTEATSMIQSHRIAVSDLAEVTQRKEKDKEFKKEFSILPLGAPWSHDEGEKPHNKKKNRYLTTFPYDHSRVKLIRTDNSDGDNSDYINANYIKSVFKEKAYIATQGPKKIILADFWKMIWQENVEKIVMVTNLVEGEKRKCDQYWPMSTTKPLHLAPFTIRMIKEQIMTIYTYRCMMITFKNSERKIHHFHFTQWPDHGVPDKTNFVKFFQKVKAAPAPLNGPLTVHCSAGIGRTGTFIALDALYESGRETGFVNVLEYTNTMRNDRMSMIQTVDQYTMVYKALVEIFTVKFKPIPVSDFVKFTEKLHNSTQENRLNEEFTKLQELKPIPTSDKCKAGNLQDNKHKNFSQNIIPFDDNRPFLMTYGRHSNDYINAVIIPSYRENLKYFATQNPLKKTVGDFWSLVYDNYCSVVVLLDSCDEGETMYPLVDGKSLVFDNFIVERETETRNSNILLTVKHKDRDETRQVTVLCYNDWIKQLNIPSSTSSMVELLNNMKQNLGHGEAVTVCCRNGSARCGLYLTLCLVMEQIDIDGEVDIFSCARRVQSRRPQCLPYFEQYQFCYEVLKDFLTRDNLYANT